MNVVITEKEYEINYYEIDYKKRALITTIINYLGDVSTKQSELRGVGIDYMKENRIAWVLYKWHINVSKYPMYGDKITVRTIPVSFKKFYAYRKFEVINSLGEKIMEASSVWLLIDIDKRKPKRITEDMVIAYGITEDNKEGLQTPKLSNFENIDIEKNFNVRYEDIDTNGHVNNAKYVSWILEAVPLDIVTKNTLRSITITYKKETGYGHCIKSCSQIINDDNEIICNHKIVNEEGKEITLAKTIWS